MHSAPCKGLELYCISLSAAEEVPQETVRIPKLSNKPRNNLSRPNHRLSTLYGNFSHHVRNSEDHVCTLDTLQVNQKDILISFDVSLFTSMLIRDAMDLIFDKDNVGLFHQVLTSLIFCFNSSSVNRQGCHGFTTVTCDCQLLQEEQEMALSKAAYKP